MKLVIAEKPSVAQSLATVTRRDCPQGRLSGRKRLACQLVRGASGWVCLMPMYITRTMQSGAMTICPSYRSIGRWWWAKTKKKQFAVLKQLMNAPDVTEVVNACDAGREGELIFRSVYELAGCQKPMKRLWISSMEDSAIREGFANLRPGADYDGLHQAALCRAKADWLVGINATRLFSVLYSPHFEYWAASCPRRWPSSFSGKPRSTPSSRFRFTR